MHKSQNSHQKHPSCTGHKILTRSTPRTTAFCCCHSSLSIPSQLLCSTRRNLHHRSFCSEPSSLPLFFQKTLLKLLDEQTVQCLCLTSSHQSTSAEVSKMTHLLSLAFSAAFSRSFLKSTDAASLFRLQHI